MMNALEPVFILDRPAHGGNIGAAMRAIGNMGFRHLRLVAPRQFPHPDAEQFAAGCGALLAGVEVYSTLEDAVADLEFLVATTNRGRGQRQVVYTPEQLGALLVAQNAARPGVRVGILFGTERTGLETCDVERAHALCTIPTSPNGPDGSLNLGQAVLIIAYELLLALGQGSTFQEVPLVGEEASMDQLARFYRHLEDVLFEIGFLKAGQERHMMGSLRAIFQRSQLDKREVAILRGVLNEVIAYPKRTSE